MNQSLIHASALVEPGAKIGIGCEIGPFCHIGPDVTLGNSVKLKSHVVVTGLTEIGQDTVVFPFSVLGEIPQDLKFKGVDVVFIGLLDQPRYMMERIKIIPDLVAENKIYKNFENYLKRL